MSDRDLVLDIVSRLNQSSDPVIEIPRLVSEFAQEHLSTLSEPERIAIETRLISRVKAAVKAQIDVQSEAGLQPLYEFSKTNDLRLIRAGHRGAYPSALRRTQLFQALHKISWKEFEDLAVHILRINGVDDYGVGARTKEGGIDFFGRLNLEKASTGILFRGCKARVFGQAKHWKHVVGKKEMDAFVTEYHHLRDGQGLALSKLPPSFVKSKEPLTPIYIALNGYTSGAQFTGRVEGVALRTGQQVAEDLLRHHQDEWFIVDESGRATLKSDRFNAFLKSLKALEPPVSR